MKHGNRGFIGTKPHTGVIWALWALALASFAIMLGGVAALQNDCNKSGANLDNSAGTVGYLAPVGCSQFYRYTWWITFLQFIVVIMVGAALATRSIHRSRSALTGIIAIATVLLMDTANTYLYFHNGVGNLAGTTKNRAEVVLAGAIVGIVANIFLIFFIGQHNDMGDPQNRGTAYDVPASGYNTAGTVPHSQNAPATGVATTV
jgi:hypothetical protein